MYDCSHFYDHAVTRTNPAILHLLLFASICHVFEHCSLVTLSFILKSQINFLRIILCQGLIPQSLRSLSIPEENTVSKLPSNIQTIIRWLRITPRLNFFVCCAQCFAIYPNEQKAPNRCNFSYISNNNQQASRVDSDSDLTICGQPLFKSPDRFPRIPVRRYATQDLFDWLAQLFARSGIEDLLDLLARRAQKPYDETHVEDIQDSRV